MLSPLDDLNIPETDKSARVSGDDADMQRAAKHGDANIYDLPKDGSIPEFMRRAS
jgi:hypothetical protein